jgi:hypothetical protein
VLDTCKAPQNPEEQLSAELFFLLGQAFGGEYSLSDIQFLSYLGKRHDHHN